MIEARLLSRRFGAKAVLHQVSFSLCAAESVAVLGPSGCGKTTLLRLLAGLDRPDEGEVHIDGRLASASGYVLPPHLRGIGFVFQSAALWPHMTVAGNILFGLADLPARVARQRLAEVVEQTALSGLEQRLPGDLSGGEARRVALARALAPRPRYLLLDEPLTSLDSDLKRELLALVCAVRRESGAGMIYVTHDREEADAVADRTMLLRDGRLEETRAGSGGRPR